MTVTLYGSEKMVAHHNLMGLVKTVQEGNVGSTAGELDAKAIRAHAISRGPIPTEPPAAGSTGLANFSPPLVSCRSSI